MLGENVEDLVLKFSPLLLFNPVAWHIHVCLKGQLSSHNETIRITQSSNELNEVIGKCFEISSYPIILNHIL